MTENRKVYTTSTPITVEAFKNRCCSLPFNHPDYAPPSSEEVRSLLDLVGLSQRKVAILTGATWTEKGSTTVRKWKAKEDVKEYRQIPYAAWRMLLEYAQVATQEQRWEALENKLKP